MAILPVSTGFKTRYNGFEFPAEYTYLTQYKIKPVPTSNGQSTKHVRVVIGLHTKISGTPADASVVNARRKLSQNGGAFQFGGRGTGPLSINLGRTKDVDFGPKVLDLDIRPIAGEQQVEIEWSVEINIPECGDAAYQFAIADYSLTMATQIRPNGRVNLVYSGELTIPNNRTAPGLRKFYDHPDKYRDRFAVQLMSGFRREWQPFTVDPTRTKLSFGWTDFEFDGMAYPPGCVKAEEGCSVSSSKWGSQSTLTLRCKYELAADAKKDVGIKAFQAFLKEKYTSVRETPGPGGKPSVIPLSFSADDPDRYGPRIQVITATLKVVGHNLATIVKAAGLWEPSKTPYQWTAWQASLRESALNPFGYSMITFDTMEEEITDLCKRISSVQIAGKGQSRGFRDADIALADIPYPTSETSWIDYKNEVKVVPDSGIASSITLTQAEPTLPTAPTSDLNKAAQVPILTVTLTPANIQPPSTDMATIFAGEKSGRATSSPGLGGTSGSGSSSGSSGGSQTGIISDPNYRATRRTNPNCYIIMTGSAIRAGFPIPCPALLEVEGVKPVLDLPGTPDYGFSSQVIRKQGNVPIMGATWKLRYFLPKVPTGEVKAPGIPQGV